MNLQLTEEQLLLQKSVREFAESEVKPCARELDESGRFPRDLFRKAAEMVDKILRGTKPGDIPVEQPTKFEFAINAKTAAALGLTIPQTFLATVDEVLK